MSREEGVVRLGYVQDAVKTSVMPWAVRVNSLFAGGRGSFGTVGLIGTRKTRPGGNGREGMRKNLLVYAK
jgi:hypothetical protein